MKSDAGASLGEPEAVVAGESESHARHSWDAMLGEVQRAIELKHEEQALQNPAAGPGASSCQSQGNTANRSVYSLLLEPALFRFPS